MATTTTTPLIRGRPGPYLELTVGVNATRSVYERCVPGTGRYVDGGRSGGDVNCITS